MRAAAILAGLVLASASAAWAAPAARSHLTDDGKAVVQQAPALACAHVDAIRAAVRDGVRAETHPLGGAALAVLEEQVAKLGVAPV